MGSGVGQGSWRAATLVSRASPEDNRWAGAQGPWKQDDFSDVHFYQRQPSKLPESWTFSIILILRGLSRLLLPFCHLGIMSSGRIVA